MTSFVERHHQVTTNGLLLTEVSTFIYGPFNHRHRLNKGHSGSKVWLASAAMCVETGDSCPVPLSHLGSEFTHSRQRQHLGESLFGLRLSVVLLVAPEVPTAPSISVPVWREIWEQTAADVWLSVRQEHCHGNQTETSVPSQKSPVLWNMGIGTSTGQN